MAAILISIFLLTKLQLLAWKGFFSYSPYPNQVRKLVFPLFLKNSYRFLIF